MRFLLPFLFAIAVKPVAAQDELTGSISRFNHPAAGPRLVVYELLDGEGLFVGPSASYEMNTLALGADVKYFNGFHFGYLPWAFYSNARYIFSSVPKVPDVAIGFGVNLLFVGLETNVYFGGDQFLWYLTPKLGFEGGKISVFYGYGLPLINNEPGRSYRHSITFKFCFGVENDD
jgi:hypothetical protein